MPCLYIPVIRTGSALVCDGVCWPICGKEGYSVLVKESLNHIGPKDKQKSPSLWAQPAPISRDRAKTWLSLHAHRIFKENTTVRTPPVLPRWCCHDHTCSDVSTWIQTRISAAAEHLQGKQIYMGQTFSGFHYDPGHVSANDQFPREAGTPPDKPRPCLPWRIYLEYSLSDDSTHLARESFSEHWPQSLLAHILSRL